MQIIIRIKDENWKNNLTEAAMNTVNKTIEDGRELTPELFRKYLISEHSPIRTMDLRISLVGISYHSSVHLVRHKVGMEHFVSTNRPDRTKKERSIDDTVTHIIDTTPQGLINMARKRLCVGKVAGDTYLIMAAIKYHLMNQQDPYLRIIGEVLVGECTYRSGCPEFKPCGFSSDINSTCRNSIKDRYKNYNEWFIRTIGGEEC